MNQLALFDDQSASPKGLRYTPEFVSAATERELIAGISALPLQRFQFGAFEGHRRVKWFGFRHDYSLQKQQPSEPIPEWLTTIAHEVERFGELPPASVRQILCTDYDVGVGIGWHRDKPHFDKVFGLSLGSPCRFRFRRRRGGGWERFTLDAGESVFHILGPGHVDAAEMTAAARREAGALVYPAEAPAQRGLFD